ncbi:MAG: GIY-YIG nuclease family protein [Flavobacterium sp.]|nr:GIY-YIG nuclease family protein [Flavobacterium sp.]
MKGEINRCIYKITSPSNAIYIGKSINIIKRQIHYRNLHCKSQKRLYNSIVKYGWENHIFEIVLENIKTDEELSEKEIFYIKKYNSFSGNNSLGLNLTLGGEGSAGIIHTDETKLKISISKKAQNKNPTLRQLEYYKNQKGRLMPKSKDWTNKNSTSIKKPIMQF